MYIFIQTREQQNGIPEETSELIKHLENGFYLKGDILSKSYFYDIGNDKELTLSQVASNLELSIDNLNTAEGNSISTYDELEECGQYALIINDNDELEIQSIN